MQLFGKIYHLIQSNLRWVGHNLLFDHVQEYLDIIYCSDLIICDITHALSIVAIQSYLILWSIIYCCDLIIWILVWPFLFFSSTVNEFRKTGFYLLEPIDPDLAHLMDKNSEKPAEGIAFLWRTLSKGLIETVLAAGAVFRRFPDFLSFLEPVNQNEFLEGIMFKNSSYCYVH